MPAQTILDSDFVTMWYHADSNIVHHSIHKFISGQQLRSALSKGAELLEQHKCTKWLSDDRGNSALNTEDSEWAKTVWFPRCLKAGWKFWGIVQPKAVVGQMNIGRFVREYAALGITAAIFTDPEEALKWLEAQ